MYAYKFFVWDEMINRYIVFIDSEQSNTIHVAPIKLFSIDSAVIIYDSKDKGVRDALEAVRDVFNSVEIESESIEVDVFNYFNSLMEFYTHRDIIFSDYKKEKLIINASSNYLPGVLALSNLCLILKKTYSFITLLRDASGNWKNRKWTQYFPSLSLRPSISDVHIKFCNKLYYDERNEFYIDDGLKIIMDLNLINDLDLNIEKDYKIAKKRLYDLVRPLIDLNILLRKKVSRKSVYQLIKN